MNLVIFQARQSNLFQAGFLTTQFPRKQWIYKAFGMMDKGFQTLFIRYWPDPLNQS